MSTGPEGYRRYRVVQTRPLRKWGVKIGAAIVWGTELGVGKVEMFDGDVLREQYGEHWPRALARELDRPSLRIEGEDGKAFVPLSRHMLGVSTVEGRRSASTESDLLGEMRTAYARAAKKPGRGEAVLHLLDHVGVNRERVPGIMRQLGFLDVRPDQVARLRADGRARIDRGELCRFCESE